MARKLVLLLLLAVAAGAWAEEKPGGIEWMHDLGKALALAKEDGRPVLAYFTFET